MKLLDVSDLEVSFRVWGRVLRVVDRIDLSLHGGETFTVVGESGCGKSVFAMSILGLLPPNAQIRGAIVYKGRNLVATNSKAMKAVRGREIGFVPQSSSTCLNPVLRIETQLAEVLRQAPSSTKPHVTIKHILHNLGLEAKVARMYPHQLSEGMKGRILVGMGISLDPTLIIADEPTNGLDIQAKNEITYMFGKIMEQKNRSLFMITHDLDVAGALPGKLAVMYAGEFVEMGSTEDILSRLPLHPYTRALLRSLPQNGFHPLPGNCPSLHNRQRGCRFANRCSRVTSLCRRQHPELTSVSGGHLVRCFYA